MCAAIDTPSSCPQVTTIVLGAYSDSTWSMDMICRAHAEDVRVLLDNPHGLGSKFKDQDQFGNVTMIANWIHDKVLTPKCLHWRCSYLDHLSSLDTKPRLQVIKVSKHYADGWVVDEEDASPANYFTSWSTSLR